MFILYQMQEYCRNTKELALGFVMFAFLRSKVVGGVKGSQGRGYAMTDRVTGNTTTELHFLKN